MEKKLYLSLSESFYSPVPHSLTAATFKLKLVNISLLLYSYNEITP